MKTEPGKLINYLNKYSPGFDLWELLGINYTVTALFFSGVQD
jgi:hypothetical protein